LHSFSNNVVTATILSTSSKPRRSQSGPATNATKPTRRKPKMSRETLLIQVNTILQSCAEIISELQSLSNENDHQKQCSCICSCSKSIQSNVSVQQSVCSDIQEEEDDWWEEESAVITSLVSRVSQNDSAIYTLTPSLEEVYTNIVEEKEVNDDVFHTEEGESNTSVDQSTTSSTSSMSTTSSAATMSSTSSTSLIMYLPRYIISPRHL